MMLLVVIILAVLARSLLTISVCRTSSRGSQIPEPPLNYAHFKMPSGGSNLPGAGSGAHFARLNFRKLAMSGCVPRCSSCFIAWAAAFEC